MRQPKIGRLIALLIGVTVVVLLTIDTTMACRFFMRRHYSFHCAPAVSYHHVYGPAHCETMISGPVVYGHSTYDECCPGPVYSSGYSSGGYIQGAPVEGTVISPPSAPPPPVVPRAAEGAGTSEVPSTPPTPPADLDDQGEVEPAIVEEPTDATPLPDEDLPTDELPADDQDLFDETPAPAPEDTPEDLFGEPPATTPPATTPPATTPPATTPPAEAMPADDLDLFDGPTTDTPATPADAATESPADDLFGTPADATQPAPLPDDSLPPATEQPLPSDTPSDAPAETDEDTDLDDLFGTSQSSSEEPDTVEADGERTVDDLFDEPAPAADQSAPADDLFQPADSSAQPAAQPEAPPEQDDSGDLDDLFSVKPAPAAQPVAVTRPVTEQIRELPMRQWTDNTGRFHTVGRLVKVTQTHVRLLKDNDRYTTVPKHRLSAEDLEYVQEITRQLGVETFDQVARR
jgi:hypothetical protein